MTRVARKNAQPAGKDDLRIRQKLTLHRRFLPQVPMRLPTARTCRRNETGGLDRQRICSFSVGSVPGKRETPVRPPKPRGTKTTRPPRQNTLSRNSDRITQFSMFSVKRAPAAASRPLHHSSCRVYLCHWEGGSNRPCNGLCAEGVGIERVEE